LRGGLLFCLALPQQHLVAGVLGVGRVRQ
jgi:hypothetical protein